MSAVKKRNLKELIITLLQKNHLLSVTELVVHLQKNNKPFNSTSVYRAIDQLLVSQVICQHFFSGTEAFYELREHHHDHLVCNKCGAVKAAYCNYEQPDKLGNFLVDHHHTTVFGLCNKCQ